VPALTQKSEPVADDCSNDAKVENHCEGQKTEETIADLPLISVTLVIEGEEVQSHGSQVDCKLVHQVLDVDHSAAPDIVLLSS